MGLTQVGICIGVVAGTVLQTHSGRDPTVQLLAGIDAEAGRRSAHIPVRDIGVAAVGDHDRTAEMAGYREPVPVQRLMPVLRGRMRLVLVGVHRRHRAVFHLVVMLVRRRMGVRLDLHLVGLHLSCHRCRQNARHDGHQ